MRAMQVTETSGPDGLRLRDVPPPDGDGVLIDVRVAGVSYPDLLLSRGEYQDQPEVPFTPGVEVAGVVRTAPAESGLAPGDRVAAFVRRGGWAEQARCVYEHVFPLPDDLAFDIGAALPLNYLTAHLALTRRAHMQSGETVLVLGSSGGLGTAVMQLANGLGGRTIAVTSNSERATLLTELGASSVVYGDDWPAAVADLTGGAGVDLVVDPVGGAAFDDALRLLRPEGRLVVLGFASGQIPSVRLNRLLLRNVDLIGVAWGPTLRRDPGYGAQQWAEVIALRERGYVRPLLGGTYELAEAAQALRDLAARRRPGKLLLRCHPQG